MLSKDTDGNFVWEPYIATHGAINISRVMVQRSLYTTGGGGGVFLFIVPKEAGDHVALYGHFNAEEVEEFALAILAKVKESRESQ